MSRLNRAGVRKEATGALVDQAISSLSNFAFIVVVARTSDVSEFGGFALVYLLFGIALGGGRAMGGEVLLLHAARWPGRRHVDAGRLLGLQLQWSVPLAGFLFLASFAAGGSLADPMRAFAVVLPLLVVQDAARYAFFARREPWRAAWNDLVWVFVQAAAFTTVLVAGWGEPAALILAWGGAAGVAAGVALIALRLAPRRPAGWVRDDLPRVSSFLGDFALGSGTAYVAASLVGVVSGLPAVAAVRGALLLFAPLDAAVTGLRVVVLPTLARASGAGPARLRARARLVALGLGAAAVAWSVLVGVLPDGAGEAVLGDTWESAEPIVWIIAALCVARTIASPAVDGIRALGGGRRLIGLRALTGALVVCAVIPGAVLGDAEGAAVAMAIAYAIDCVVWWLGLRHATRCRGPRSATSSPSESSTPHSARPRSA